MTKESGQHNGPDVRRTLIDHGDAGKAVVNSIPAKGGGVDITILNIPPDINADSLAKSTIEELARAPQEEVVGYHRGLEIIVPRDGRVKLASIPKVRIVPLNSL